MLHKRGSSSNGEISKVFIDANIINLAVVYKREDVLGWINSLYEDIYIHISVMDELLTNKTYAEEQIENGKWYLFNPEDEHCLSDEQFIIYENYLQNVRDGFHRLNIKKKNQGREIKNTSNSGEIDSLAAAILLSANIICSNDYEIREVIEDEDFRVAFVINMAMESFQINLPKEYLPIIHTLDGKDIDTKVRISLAIGLFVEKQVTLARAAELSGKSLGDFIDLLRSRKIAWNEYTGEHLNDDNRAIQELLGGNIVEDD